MSLQSVPMITIDGPSGVGKGTVGLQIASQLGWHFLDSGAMYRVTAYAALLKKVDLNNEALLTQVAATLDVQFIFDKAKERTQIVFEGQDISSDIRTEAVSDAASRVSAFPSVRNALLARQRAFLKAPGLVADGRDMGTVVFHNAPLKIFLDASIEERAKRRFNQLSAAGQDVTLTALLEEMENRDKRDRTRAVAPLLPARDAVMIDTTALSVDAVVLKVFQEIHRVYGIIPKAVAVPAS